MRSLVVLATALSCSLAQDLYNEWKNQDDTLNKDWDKNIGGVPGRTCVEHCECGSTKCANNDTAQDACFISGKPPFKVDPNETYSQGSVGCCVPIADCEERCSPDETAIANDFLLLIQNFTSINCENLFQLELTGDAENELDLCRCFKEGLNGALAADETTLEKKYNDAVEDLRLADCRLTKGSVHTVKKISELCMGSAARDDPFFNTGTEKIKFWLPSDKMTPLLKWNAVTGEHASLSGEVFSFNQTTPASKNRKNVQWFGSFFVDVGSKTLLKIVSRHKTLPDATGALAPKSMNEDVQSFIDVQLDGRTLSVQHADDAPIVHASKDGSLLVTVNEYSERHIGNQKAERVVVKTGSMEFVIWSNKAGKFASDADQIKYAHLNFDMKGVFPPGATGLFPELQGVTPISETSKGFLKLARERKAPAKPKTTPKGKKGVRRAM